VTLASAAQLQLKQLDWDTAFFGARFGTVERMSAFDSGARSEHSVAVDERELRLLLAQARAERYAHLIFRAASDDYLSIWAAEHAGLRLVDVGIDSSRELRKRALPSEPTAIQVRPAAANDEPVLQDLAGGAFTLSRFAADPFFTPAEVREFHRTWVANLCRGLAQCVLVCEIDKSVVGFVSCAVTADEGRIPLIATASAYRGRGIGFALVAAALRWFASADCRVVHVKTQAHNFGALALYHRAGFTTSHVELTFSIALGSERSHA
jgi:ribosomal protein S18 acetylase RimI-like enzyme